MPIRTLHAYIGMLIAPAVIFFASTGLLQIYSLHESHPGYTAPALLEELGSVHKDQRFAAGHHGSPHGTRPPGDAERAQGHDRLGLSKGRDDYDASKSHLATGLLKAFFAAVALGLIFSTSSGVWMGLRQSARRRTHLVLLVAGTVIPVALAALTM